MYYSNQTLYHKETHKIVALNPSKNNCSQWNWEVGENSGKTHFIDENGVTFWDKLDNYIHFENFIREAEPGFIDKNSPNPYVDITLKKFLVFGKERERKIKNELNKRCREILKKIDEDNFVFCPFKSSWNLFKHFKNKVKSKPLFFQKTKITFYPKKEIILVNEPSYLTFSYKEKLYFLTMNEIYLIELNK